MAQPAVSAVDPPPAVAVPAEVLARYVGRYSINPDVEANVRLESGHLFGALTGRPEHELIATSPTHFLIPDADAAVTFELGEDGVPTGLVLTISGHDTEARRETPAP